VLNALTSPLLLLPGPPSCGQPGSRWAPQPQHTLCHVTAAGTQPAGVEGLKIITQAGLWPGQRGWFPYSCKNCCGIFNYRRRSRPLVLAARFISQAALLAAPGPAAAATAFASSSKICLFYGCHLLKIRGSGQRGLGLAAPALQIPGDGLRGGCPEAGSAAATRAAAGVGKDLIPGKGCTWRLFSRTRGTLGNAEQLEPVFPI